ncbi:MAG TPA: hypothetical protein VIJ23_19585 [Mycobacterium sp.]
MILWSKGGAAVIGAGGAVLVEISYRAVALAVRHTDDDKTAPGDTARPS